MMTVHKTKSVQKLEDKCNRRKDFYSRTLAISQATTQHTTLRLMFHFNYVAIQMKQNKQDKLILAYHVWSGASISGSQNNCRESSSFTTALATTNNRRRRWTVRTHIHVRHTLHLARC